MRTSRIAVRASSIAGLGAFAARPLRKGSRIVEYVGERISTDEADARYEGGPAEHPHVLLFTVDDDTVIDAGVDANEARFINHSCEPNCETVVRGGRVWIYALRNIKPGEELTYDYNLTGEDDDRSAQMLLYACHCGTASCRGTMFGIDES